MGRNRLDSNSDSKKVKKAKKESLKTVANVALRRSSRTANKSQIGSNRVTVPCGFFSSGVSSHVAKKSSKPATNVLKEESRKILDEDLHGLLQTAGPAKSEETGRSSKLNGSGYYQNVSDYYLSLITNECPEKKVPEVSTDSDWYVLPNENFCSELRKQLKVAPKSIGSYCLNRIKQEVKKIDDIISGRSESPVKMSSGHKRPVPTDDEPTKVIPLIPQSQWVYSTPDKQNIKKFVFQDGSTKCLPAVMHTTKNTKVLYDIKNKYVQHVNLNKFKAGEGVPIDKRYLKTICEKSVNNDSAKPLAKKQRTHDKENVFNFDYTFAAPQPVAAAAAAAAAAECNMFLSGQGEETLDIGEAIGSNVNRFNFERCHSALLKEIPMDYQHQLLMATERPSKTTKRVARRHLLKAKCLSFETTPPSAKGASFEPKKLMSWKSFEEDCLNDNEMRVFRPASDAPHTITSGALLDAVPSSDTFVSCLPPHKFYPRRNFDPE